MGGFCSVAMENRVHPGSEDIPLLLLLEESILPIPGGYRCLGYISLSKGGIGKGKLYSEGWSPSTGCSTPLGPC